MLEFALAGAVSVYFSHKTRSPNNVLLAWHNMTLVPRVGDLMSGPMGHWRVLSVTWVAQNDDHCKFCGRVDVFVEDVDAHS
jgi:hypothetical protein